MIAIGQTGLPKSGILVELTPGEYEALYHLATAVAGLPGTVALSTVGEVPPQVDLAPALEYLRDFAELRYVLNDLQHQANLLDRRLAGAQPEREVDHERVR